MPLTGAAAARLYDDHVESVHALIARRVGPEAAPAITAETFELTLRTWDRFDSRRGTERLFLYGAATTTLRRHPDVEREHLRSLRIPTRENGGDILDPLVSGPRTSTARVVEHEANQDLRGDDNARRGDRAIRTHPSCARCRPSQNSLPMTATSCLLSLWESCPQSSIAEALDLSVSDVRSALGRIRRELKISIGKDRVVNVFDTIHSIRPEVDPMPLTDRRMIRESLFGVGHDDAARTFGARSESGAVVSTAPHGTRVALRKRPRSTGSLFKMAAGILVVGAVGAVAWSMLSETVDDEAVPRFIGAEQCCDDSPTGEPPPSTEAPFVRTGVTRSAPLVLPPSLRAGRRGHDRAIDPGQQHDAALRTRWESALDGRVRWCFR